jgi:hypothetical protein
MIRLVGKNFVGAMHQELRQNAKPLSHFAFPCT